MDEALAKIGLPVKCRKCKKKGNVKPRTNYDGWYKSKFLRKSNKWFCPEHHDTAKYSDERFYDRSITPAPEPTVETTTEELYKLLD